METPDCWQIIKITSKDKEVLYKVMAGWGGDYLHGPSWRLNSGIARIEKKDDTYLVHGASGSIYSCRKDLDGLNGYTSGVLDGLIYKLMDLGATVKLVSIKEAIKELKKCQTEVP